jgi:hypothetical protein
MTFMSSPKAAVRTARSKVKPASARAPARKVKAAATVTTKRNGSMQSAQALELAAAIEQGIRSGEMVVSEEARQKLMAALCKIYSARIQAGVPEPVLGARSGVSPTDVMITASGLLKAADLQVFELGMWQSWTGR